MRGQGLQGQVGKEGVREMIRYREGYKYQLAEEFSIATPVKDSVQHEFFTLTEDGVLTIRAGYAWDGASGPTIDTKDSMEPALVHDAFCQAMRIELLSYNKWHRVVNEFFYEHCKACGMNAFRAWIWYKAVSFANAGRPDGNDPNPILEAP